MQKMNKLSKATSLLIALIPNAASAEINFSAAVLVGNTLNNYSAEYVYHNHQDFLEEYTSNQLGSTSTGIRFSADITKNFSLEMSWHDLGKTHSEVTYTMQTVDSVSGIVLPKENDIKVIGVIDIQLNAIKFGGAYHWQLLPKFNMTGRLGLANWYYDKKSPQELIPRGHTSYHSNKGVDIFYGMGLRYTMTENLFVMVEYSGFIINKRKSFEGFFEDGEQTYDNFSYSHMVNDLSLAVGWKF